MGMTTVETMQRLFACLSSQILVSLLLRTTKVVLFCVTEKQRLVWVAFLPGAILHSSTHLPDPDNGVMTHKDDPEKQQSQEQWLFVTHPSVYPSTSLPTSSTYISIK